MICTHVLGGSWVRQSRRIKTISLICNGNNQLRLRVAASEYDYSLGRIFMVAVQNCVRQSLD